MNRKSDIRRLMKGWLFHVTIMWSIIVTIRIGQYLLETKQGVVILRDGKELTVWRYFLDFQDDFWKVALFLFFAETCFVYFFHKVRLPVFMLCCIVAGILICIPIDLLRPHLIHDRILSAVAPILSMAAYAFVYAVVRDYVVHNRRRKALQLQQAEHELHALKVQLNPHFLFNSLNYLYGTALREHAADTAEAIDRLSGMMRYTISGMHENMVSLDKEINFVRHYIALQQVRLPDARYIKLDIDPLIQIGNFQISPLIMLPFLENAFTYGISIDQPELISISIKLEGHMLTLTVNNSIVTARPDTGGNGTGIKNTLKRLKLLYPNSYDYRFNRTDDRYSMTLILNLKPL